MKKRLSKGSKPPKKIELKKLRCALMGNPVGYCVVSHDEKRVSEFFSEDLENGKIPSFGIIQRDPVDYDPKTSKFLYQKVAYPSVWLYPSNNKLSIELKDNTEELNIARSNGGDDIHFYIRFKDLSTKEIKIEAAPKLIGRYRFFYKSPDGRKRYLIAVLNGKKIKKNNRVVLVYVHPGFDNDDSRTENKERASVFSLNDRDKKALRSEGIIDESEIEEIQRDELERTEKTKSSKTVRFSEEVTFMDD